MGDSGQFMLLKRDRDWTMGMDHRYTILSIIYSSLSLVALDKWGLQRREVDNRLVERDSPIIVLVRLTAFGPNCY